MPFTSKITSAASGWKEKAWFKNISRRKYILAILALLVVAPAGILVYRSLSQASSQSEVAVSSLQTATVQQGDLILYASGTGMLTASRQASLAFKTGGQVTTVLVEVGDVVEAGDLLAQVDDTDVQIKYEQAKRSLAELTSPSSVAAAQKAIAQAQIDLDSSTSTLGYLISPWVLHCEKDVTQAEQLVRDAETKVQSSPSDADVQKQLDDAKIVLEAANKRLTGAWAYYEQVYLKKYFSHYKVGGSYYISAPTDAEILAARASVAQAQASLEESQDLYAALTGGEVPEDATGADLLTLEKAKLAVESAKSTLDGTRIYAPIPGTIMSLDTFVGDTVENNSTVMTIADLGELYLETYLDETDWNKVAVGKQADVVFDALPDKDFTGEVTQVDRELYTSGNSSMIRSLVSLNSTFSEINLPLGSGAAVEVLGGESQNTLLIPVEALHKAGTDKYAVFVVQNGKIRLRLVEVGLQDILYIEIKSGLQAGDVVTTGITETR